MPEILQLRALNNAGIQRFADFITETRDAEESQGNSCLRLTIF